METTGYEGLSILVLEDEVLLRKQIVSTLERLGADVTATGTIESARQLLSDLSFDLALVDVHLPDGESTALLQEKVFPRNTGVIVMTAHGGIGGAVEAMRLGALDYMAKPFDPGELPLVIRRAWRHRQNARVEEHRQQREPGELFFFGSALAPVEAQLEKILAADRRLQGELPPVLIEGETGTGKTTIARWIHSRGPRAAQPLVEVNCSALPEALAESELFGHERGAFTDARSKRMGLFEASGGGTLFLDELPSLSLPLQAKVLKAIEDRRIRRVGGTREIAVDIRIIAATNRPLRPLAAEGAFREDLFHRLDLFRIHLAPLRERGEDVIQIAELFIERLCRKHRLSNKAISSSGRQRLLRYPWPGNVRELAHELERAIVFEEGRELDFPHLLAEGVEGGADKPGPHQWLNPNFRFPEEGFSLEAAIQELIGRALEQTGQNVSAAARLLGVSRDYLRYRLSGKTENGK